MYLRYGTVPTVKRGNMQIPQQRLHDTAHEKGIVSNPIDRNLNNTSNNPDRCARTRCVTAY